MKAITLSAALMLLGSLTLGMADATIDEQITAIKNAPAQERVQLMNQFKERLATMNASEREAAIKQMRIQIQARQQSGENEGEQLQMRTQTQERSRVNQMQQTEQMPRMEEMQQRKNGDQEMQGSMDNMQQNMKNPMQAK
ncbi:MAG: hypothetical protein MUP09_03680 [Thiovulaceae bacterium]|nr:hypothetical protein [Sulfurimonadaceae bacterium]